MSPETPNPDSPKAVLPHRLLWLFGATVAPVFSIPWIVAELQGRQFSDASLLFMLTEGVAVTLLLRWLCQIWPNLLASSLRWTQPKGAWKKPAAVGGGIVIACVANSFFSAYGLIGLPMERPPDRSGMFTLLLLIGMIWLIGAFGFVLAIAAAALKPNASVQEIHSADGVKDLT